MLASSSCSCTMIFSTTAGRILNSLWWLRIKLTDHCLTTLGLGQLSLPSCISVSSTAQAKDEREVVLELLCNGITGQEREEPWYAINTTAAIRVLLMRDLRMSHAGVVIRLSQAAASGFSLLHGKSKAKGSLPHSTIRTNGRVKTLMTLLTQIAQFLKVLFF